MVAQTFGSSSPFTNSSKMSRTAVVHIQMSRESLATARNEEFVMTRKPAEIRKTVNKCLGLTVFPNRV
jgi:hypothetical protein